MIDESDWPRQDLRVYTTSGMQLHQTIPWARGWLARLLFSVFENYFADSIYNELVLYACIGVA